MRKPLAVFTALITAFLLAGCIGNPPRQTELARHDLGDLPGTWSAAGIPIAGLSVRAPSWLDTPEQMYRLSYADDLRRRVYTESRWVAPPAELFERFLRQRIVFGQPDFSVSGCRLDLVLDELEQRFETPRQSGVVLEMRATLLPAHGKGVLSKRSFIIRQAAPTPDARGGVTATRAAAQQLADALAGWLVGVAHDRQQTITACRQTAG